MDELVNRLRYKAAPAAQAFINSHFNNDGPRPSITIPANRAEDSDLVLVGAIKEAADHIEKLEAENARLRDALHPFADAADEADDCGFEDSNQAPVEVGDCRIARQALEAK